jgi:NTP pyrophosphatase (non-canonical NTP hydrolase)
LSDWRKDGEVIHATLAHWPVYGEEDRRFLALALNGEAGELANLIKKEWRGDFYLDGMSREDVKAREDVAMEIADVRIYLEHLAHACGVDIDEACERKIEILLERWPHVRKAVEETRG